MIQRLFNEPLDFDGDIRSANRRMQQLNDEGWKILSVHFPTKGVVTFFAEKNEKVKANKIKYILGRGITFDEGKRLADKFGNAYLKGDALIVPGDISVATNILSDTLEVTFTRIP